MPEQRHRVTNQDEDTTIRVISPDGTQTDLEGHVSRVLAVHEIRLPRGKRCRFEVLPFKEGK